MMTQDENRLTVLIVVVVRRVKEVSEKSRWKKRAERVGFKRLLCGLVKSCYLAIVGLLFFFFWILVCDL